MKVYHYCLNEFDNLLCEGFEVEFIFDLSDILTDSVKLHLRSERGLFDVDLSIFNCGNGYYIKKLSIREERILKEVLLLHRYNLIKDKETNKI